MFKRFASLNQEGFAHTLLIVLATIGLVAILANTTNHIITVRNDAKKFDAMKQEVNTLGEQINEKYPATRAQAVQSCHYSSAKYTKGPRSCQVSYYFQYENIKNKLEAEQQSTEIFAVISQHYKVISLGETYGPDSEIDANRILMNNDSCSSQSFYVQSPEMEPSLPDLPWPNETEGLLLVMGCSEGAKAEHFPLRD